MGWRSWNKADKTLLAAMVIFFFALCVHLQYRDRVVADCFLFCAEAALVGGASYDEVALADIAVAPPL